MILNMEVFEYSGILFKFKLTKLNYVIHFLLFYAIFDVFVKYKLHFNMEIKFTSLHQVDHHLNSVEEIDIENQSEDLINYTQRLITEITEGTSKRKFNFRRDTTEVRSVLGQFMEGDYSGKGANANRLLDVEKTTQLAIAHLGNEIQKGSLFQAHIEDGESTIMVISKADQIQFLDEDDFNLKNGLPYEKKIFKAFLVRFEAGEAKETFVYDTTTRLATYWWDTFLELDEVYTSEYNTKTALKLLDSKVLNNMKKKFPADHTRIRNKAVGYFQSQNQFEMGNFLEATLNDYVPIDNDFPKTAIIEKIRNLPERYSFDSQFPIAEDQVTARKVKSKINLTDKVDLVIKENIPELDSTISGFLDSENRKYIIIRTDTGYEHFKGNSLEISDEEE